MKLKTNRPTNRQARSFVEERLPFITKNATIFAEQTHLGSYVVYSYGKHWPLHICDFTMDKEYIFSNETKYSMTTSHHFGLTRPTHTSKLLSVDKMLELVRVGLVGLPEDERATLLEKNND